MFEALVILDRDGVINQDSQHFIKTLDEWIPIPGSLEAVARLSHAGYRVAIATNQSGLARRFLTPSTLGAIHAKLCGLVTQLGGRVDLIVFCPHGPDEGCACRKPRPGMLLEIKRRMGVELTGVPFIGDSIGDVVAARAAGAVPLMVRTGKGEGTLAAGGLALQGVDVYPDLAAVVDDLLGT